ncbi:MAG: DUF1080 domain-containing protein [Planctomycetota bacterium]
MTTTIRQCRIMTIAMVLVSCWAPSLLAQIPNQTDELPDNESTSVDVRVFDVSAPGWRQLTGNDFARVNGDETTLVWSGKEALGSGQPIGVTRTKFTVRNFELAIEWMHLNAAGNSGVFAWVPQWALDDLPPNQLPKAGIEIQMLDHAFAQKYAERSRRPGDWFTTHGDVFAVGKSMMQPFPPLSPSGRRSFPSARTTRGAGQWNQYYVRGINGEIRLWVNGVEVSGGSSCSPCEGFLCLESEGSPIRFREIHIRQLP